MKQWEAYIRKVTPYTAGEQPNEKDMIKLNTNENPYPPSPSVQKKYQELELSQLRLYPDPNSSELVQALEKYHGLDRGQVFVGVGSDDVLSIAFQTFFNSGKPILFPDITYSFYPVWARMYGIPYKTPQLNEKFEIVPSDYAEENGGVIFANPNAPTSIALPLEGIQEMLQYNQDVVVMVDEAYIDFGGQSALSLLRQYENLLVIRTYSKSRSMAGVRIGYAMGHETLIRAMNHVKESVNSYTMSYISISLGAAALPDEEYFQNKITQIISTREHTKKRLEDLGFKVLDSSANFLFVKHSRHSAKMIFHELRKLKIYVRYFEKPRIDQYLRISIGTEEEMGRALEALEQIV
ncbi:MAG: histidinol-phosphate transaminase [Lachnoclostridium sp.]|jgi:histidinol-phosphate aminotransferase|nr:histidinol-phosphate transaminase [Lachnoclostridium sp.]